MKDILNKISNVESHMDLMDCILDLKTKLKSCRLNSKITNALDDFVEFNILYFKQGQMPSKTSLCARMTKYIAMIDVYENETVKYEPTITEDTSESIKELVKLLNFHTKISQKDLASQLNWSTSKTNRIYSLAKEKGLIKNSIVSESIYTEDDLDLGI